MSPAHRRGAACVSGWLSGIGKQKRSSATASSAKPPSTSYPVKRALSHRFSSTRRRQYRQTPHVTIRATARRRVLRERTRVPPPTTSPTIWCPRTSGSFGCSSSPSRTWGSVRHAAGSHLRTTCPGAGAGSGTSRSTSLVRGAPSRIMALTTPPLIPASDSIAEQRLRTSTEPRTRRLGCRRAVGSRDRAGMFQVRIHGRGGQGVVTAAELLSVAAFLEGREAQAFPTFGSERTGAPVVAFCRIDDSVDPRPGADHGARRADRPGPDAAPPGRPLRAVSPTTATCC